MPAKFVIHTVGPIWRGGSSNESQLLACCYFNSLQIATNNNCRSIAFPGISTGVYKFPKKEAAEIAVSTVKEFLRLPGNLKKVIFVCFDDVYFAHIKNELKSVVGN